MVVIRLGKNSKLNMVVMTKAMANEKWVSS